MELTENPNVSNKKWILIFIIIVVIVIISVILFFIFNKSPENKSNIPQYLFSEGGFPYKSMIISCQGGEISIYLSGDKNLTKEDLTVLKIDNSNKNIDYIQFYKDTAAYNDLPGYHFVLKLINNSLIPGKKLVEIGNNKGTNKYEIFCKGNSHNYDKFPIPSNKNYDFEFEDLQCGEVNSIKMDIINTGNNDIKKENMNIKIDDKDNNFYLTSVNESNSFVKDIVPGLNNTPKGSTGTIALSDRFSKGKHIVIVNVNNIQKAMNINCIKD